MNADTFHKMVTDEGFNEPVMVTRDPNGFIDTHEHPFEAKALILDGQIEIGLDSDARVYRPGDVFHLAMSESHWERYGPAGVVYLSARKE